MPTKPSITVPTWATNTNYSVGPTDIPGTPTKVDYSTVVANGHIPAGDDGDPNPNPSTAQHMNDFQNRVAQTCQWVLAGSSTGAADAHIVETNASGKTSVTGLTVTGPASGDALIVQKITSSTSAIYASSTQGTVTALGNSDSILLDVGGTVDGVVVSVSGNHVPYSMAVQTVAPTTFYNTYVPLFAKSFASGGNTGVTLNTALRSTREYIPTFTNQHLRRTATASSVSVSPGGGETNVITGVQWVQRKMPHAANTPLLLTLTFQYDNGTVASPVDVFFYNNAAAIGPVRRFYPTTTNEGQMTIRLVYSSGSLAGMSDSYKVTMACVAGIDVDLVVLTIETTE